MSLPLGRLRATPFSPPPQPAPAHAPAPVFPPFVVQVVVWLDDLLTELSATASDDVDDVDAATPVGDISLGLSVPPAVGAGHLHGRRSSALTPSVLAELGRSTPARRFGSTGSIEPPLGPPPAGAGIVLSPAPAGRR
jgi:hypothetical protein